MQPQNTTTKKTICFLSRPMIIGGVERVLRDTVRILAPFYNVVIISMYGDSDPKVVQEMQEAGATVILPHLSNNAFFMAIPYMSSFHYGKELKKFNCDYLVCLNNDAINASFYRKAKKTICWNHTDNVEKHRSPKGVVQKIKSGLMKILHRRYDTVWTVCDKIKDDYIVSFNLKDVQVLQNPLDFDRLIDKSNQPCEFETDKKRINIFTLGRLSDEKGFDRLIKIWATHINDSFPNAQLNIIGDGASKIHLETLIKENHLEDKVFLLGKQENPFPYLKQADLFISSSYSESFGLVILEAMALGIPVITTATAGGKYVTKDGTLAMCVENTDEALTDAILKFLEAPEKYPYNVEEARKEAQSYDLPHYQENILRLLKQLED